MSKPGKLLFLYALSGLSLLLPDWLYAQQKGTVLWYLEQEQGIDPYRVRYVITNDYMRSDEGQPDGGYVLFDRKERQIYTVAPESGTIVKIDGKGTLPEPPGHLSIQVKRTIDRKAPRVAGQFPVTIELTANEELCYSAVVVPGLLDQAQAALLEFAQSLAIRQARTLANTPKEYQTPCFLSRYLYATDFYLQQGVPLAHWSNETDRRELVGFETGVVLEEQLFTLPSEFQVISDPGS